MEHTKLTELLHQVASGDISVEKAALELKTEPFEDLGFAKLDHHRKIRQGFMVPEKLQNRYERLQKLFEKKAIMPY